MNFRTLSATATLALASGLAAQSAYTGPANFVFSMDFTTWPNAAIGFDQAAGEAQEEAVLTFSPGNNPFPFALNDYSTWSVFLGDEDGDGSYTDSIITDIHACWVPPGAPCPPSIHDVYLSIATDTDMGGALGGAVIDDGDVFRILPSGAIETFLSLAQVVTATSTTTSPSSIDINGFTVDPATGDLYLTFTANVDVNGTTVTDDGIVRIPASGFTTVAGPLTPVATMNPGVAEIVMTQADVNAVAANAGQASFSDLFGIEIDPAGGTYTSPSTGLTMPNLWLVNDNSSANFVLSTATDALGTAGVIPTVNGLPLDTNTAFGFANPGPTTFAPGNMSALAFQAANPVGTPLHVDTYQETVATPGTVDVDISGGTPGGFVLILGELFNTNTVGGFAPRTSGLPVAPSPQSWMQSYIINVSGPTSFVIPDAEGFGRYTLTVPVAIPAGEMVVWQAFDFDALTISNPTHTITN